MEFRGERKSKIREYQEGREVEHGALVATSARLPGKGKTGVTRIIKDKPGCSIFTTWTPLPQDPTPDPPPKKSHRMHVKSVNPPSP